MYYVNDLFERENEMICLKEHLAYTSESHLSYIKGIEYGTV